VRLISHFILWLLLGAASWSQAENEPQQEPLQQPLKVAFVYVAPVGDAGWTLSHDLGRQHVQQLFGERIETQFVEAVAPGRNATEVLEQLVEQGNDMIFTTSWGYMVPTDRVAQSHPNVLFEHATGIRRGDNLSTYANRAYQGRYLAGMVAGAMSESGKIGYVAAHPVVEIIRGINAFTLGARSVNPEVEVAVEWSRSWYDPATEARLTHGLINDGADIIVQHTDSPTPVRVAERRGVYSMGYHTDMSPFAPERHLLSVVHQWGPIYEQRIRAALQNEWQAGDVWPGLEAETVALTGWHQDIPAEVRQQVEAVRAQFSNGERRVFVGPINNYRGRTQVREEHELSDLELTHMDWFVEGTRGDLRSF
jgi:basic membrane lipoprotein Med (substrate-binding protein (PBP1-ABC) superfamily)